MVQSTESPELTEARQEFSQQKWLASVLHHEFYQRSNMEVGDDLSVLSKKKKKKKAWSVGWILCIAYI